MEIQSIVILLVLAVISSLATRLVVGGIYENFKSDSNSIPIQDILKHISIGSIIVSKNNNEYWSAHDNPNETIHLKGLAGGLIFKSLTINNTQQYRPLLRIATRNDCHTNGESWGVYISPGKSGNIEPSIDIVNHENGYIATDSGISRTRIQKEFNQPGMSIGILSQNLKIGNSTIETPPPPPPAPPCPGAGEIRIWNGACMTKNRMDAEFKYWSTPSRVAEFKRKNQFKNLKENLNKLNQDYKKLTGKPYPLNSDFN